MIINPDVFVRFLRLKRSKRVERNGSNYMCEPCLHGKHACFEKSCPCVCREIK